MEGKKKVMWNMKGRMIFLSSISWLTLVVGRGGGKVRDFVAFFRLLPWNVFIFVQKFLRNILFLISLSIRMAWVVSAKMSSVKIFKTILWIFKPTQNITLNLNASFKMIVFQSKSYIFWWCLHFYEGVGICSLNYSLTLLSLFLRTISHFWLYFFVGSQFSQL